MIVPTDDGSSALRRLLEVFRASNEDLATAYEELRRANAGLRAQRDRLSSRLQAAEAEVAFLRSRAGYRAVDRAHALLKRSGFFYPVAKMAIHLLDRRPATPPFTPRGPAQ
jgi:hypothetical protein